MYLSYLSTCPTPVSEKVGFRAISEKRLSKYGFCLIRATIFWCSFVSVWSPMVPDGPQRSLAIAWLLLCGSIQLHRAGFLFALQLTPIELLRQLDSPGQLLRILGYLFLASPTSSLSRAGTSRGTKGNMRSCGSDFLHTSKTFDQSIIIICTLSNFHKIPLTTNWFWWTFIKMSCAKASLEPWQHFAQIRTCYFDTSTTSLGNCQASLPTKFQQGKILSSCARPISEKLVFKLFWKKGVPIFFGFKWKTTFSSLWYIWKGICEATARISSTPREQWKSGTKWFAFCLAR